MRIITNELFNALVAELLKDSKVRVFQQLLMSEKTEKPLKSDGEKEQENGL